MAGKSSFLIFLFTFFSWFCNDTFGHVITRNLEPRRVLKDKHPVHGVEVNGLLFPLESTSPGLFRRASDISGGEIRNYYELCELLPQDKLDSLMQEHWTTFITDYDFSLLKEATIDSLRIPVPYGAFLSEGERTDKFPKGQALALDKFIKRTVSHGLNVWFDLIATPNTRLGKLEDAPSPPDPQLVRRVVEHIARKYNSKDVNAVLVHPDIAFPDIPESLTPLDPTSIRATKDSQLSLYQSLSSTLSDKGILLAIDSTYNLGPWAMLAPTFPHRVILVSSLKTGLLAPNQRTVSRLLAGVKADMEYVREVARTTPVALTWDASINKCILRNASLQDCSLDGQLWAASGGDLKDDDWESAKLNDFTEDFALDLLKQIDSSGIVAWFFRTAKIQDPAVKGSGHEVWGTLLRRRSIEPIISGNDFLSMYDYGMLPKNLVPPEKKKDISDYYLPFSFTMLGTGAVLGTISAWDKIKDKVPFIQKIEDAVKTTVGGAVDSVKNFFGPKEPSRHVQFDEKVAIIPPHDDVPPPQEMLLPPQKDSEEPPVTAPVSHAVVPPLVIPEIVRDYYSYGPNSPDSLSVDLPDSERSSVHDGPKMITYTDAPPPPPLPLPPVQQPPSAPAPLITKPQPQPQPPLPPSSDDKPSEHDASLPISITKEPIPIAPIKNSPPVAELPKAMPPFDTISEEVSSEAFSTDDWEMIDYLEALDMYPLAEGKGRSAKDIIGDWIRPSWSNIDKSKLPPVHDTIEHFEAEPEPPHVVQKVVDSIPEKHLAKPGSVAESIARLESLASSAVGSQRNSNRNSRQSSNRNSWYSSNSEFGLSKGVAPGEETRRLSDIEREMKEKGVPEEEWARPLVPRPRPKTQSMAEDETKRYGKVISKEEREELRQMFRDSWDEVTRKKLDISSLMAPSPELPKSPTSEKENGKPQTEGKQTEEEVHDEKDDDKSAASKPEDTGLEILRKAAEGPETDRIHTDTSFNPDVLTHLEQDRYARPHAGSGEGSPHLSPSLTKLRKETEKERTENTPQAGHHVIGGENARPMEIHAPRHKDMDPNHPKNLKKMKPKEKEYVPYPPPEAKKSVKSHHVSTHKVVESSKGLLGNREKLVTEHDRQSVHMHKDLEAAMHAAGHVVPLAPQNGIGKDPRLDFEEEHWTDEDKAGYRAYVEELRKEANEKAKGTNQGQVDRLATFWNNYERKEPSLDNASQKSEHRKSGVSDHVKSVQEKLVEEQSPGHDEERAKSSSVFVPRVRTSLEERKKVLAKNTHRPLRGTMANAGQVEMMPPTQGE